MKRRRPIYLSETVDNGEKSEEATEQAGDSEEEDLILYFTDSD